MSKCFGGVRNRVFTVQGTYQYEMREERILWEGTEGICENS